jgi:cytochrome b pre-mRNA-processing protein 3
MLCLHIWMLLVRLRPEGSDGKKLAQLMYDDFQEDVEKRVRAAGVQVRLRKHLVELEKQFYGSCIAYDKTMKDEPTEPLSAALHRNVYQAVQSKQPAASLLERYVKRELACLTMTESAAIMAGDVRFSFSLS